MRRVCDRINARGGKATYYAGDVADPAAMDELAATAVREFGGFDTWINDAGISIYGRLAVAPRLTDYYMERKLFDAQKKDYESGRPDALYDTTADGSRRGSTGSYEMKRATLTRLMLSDAGRALPYVAVAGFVAAAVAAVRRAA